MLNRRAVLWLIPAGIVTLGFLNIGPDAWTLPLTVILALVWGLTVLTLLNHPLKNRLAARLAVIRRRRVMLIWLLLLVGLVLGVFLWEAALEPQPVKDFYLFFILWMLLFFVSVGMTETELRAIGSRLQGSRLTGLMLSVTTLVVIVLLIEVLMHLFLVMSDGVGVTRMFKRWKERYWQPLNSLEYRDYEPDLQLPDSIRRVLVVGDSFVAGQGIESVDGIFAHRLGARLGAGYAVNIVAQPGWDTDDEWDHLQSYPVEPDILILSHYLNDVLWIPGFHPPPISTLPDSVPLAMLVQSLEIPNFLYWRGYFGARGDTFLYSAFYDEAYQTPALWEQQAQMLTRFVTYADERQARLVVIVWPLLKDLDASRSNNQQVIDLFTAQGVPVVDMAEVLRDIDPAQRVVNVFDAHPSRLVHDRAAEALYNVLLE